MATNDFVLRGVNGKPQMLHVTLRPRPRATRHVTLRPRPRAARPGPRRVRRRLRQARTRSRRALLSLWEWDRVITCQNNQDAITILLKKLSHPENHVIEVVPNSRTEGEQ